MQEEARVFTIEVWKERIQEKLLQASVQLRTWIDTAKEPYAVCFDLQRRWLSTLSAGKKS